MSAQQIFYIPKRAPSSKFERTYLYEMRMLSSFVKILQRPESAINISLAAAEQKINFWVKPLGYCINYLRLIYFSPNNIPIRRIYSNLFQKFPIFLVFQITQGSDI